MCRKQSFSYVQLGRKLVPAWWTAILGICIKILMYMFVHPAITPIGLFLNTYKIAYIKMMYIPCSFVYNTKKLEFLSSLFYSIHQENPKHVSFLQHFDDLIPLSLFLPSNLCFKRIVHLFQSFLLTHILTIFLFLNSFLP